MRVVDRGSGVPVVLVPGIQGRWEWMAPAVEALAARCRVITFSLADEPSAAWPARGIGFDAYVEQIGQALDALRLQRAVICGVSYGGLVAAAFLRRYPERVAGLVLVSAIPPSWAPDARARFFMRRPRLLLPLFLLVVAAAAPGDRRRVRRLVAGRRRVAPAGRAGARAFSGARPHGAPGHAHRRRGGGRAGASPRADAGRSRARPALDRVVPTALTAEYTRIWPHAAAVTLARTGHLGLVTRPEAFAEAVVPFAETCDRPVTQTTERRVG